MTHFIDKYYVAKWNNDEVIAIFDTDEERQEWLRKNVDIDYNGGYLKDGTKIQIWEW